MKGKPNWEHLNEELHVLVVVEDTQRRAEVKMQRAVDEIKRLLVPAVSNNEPQFPVLIVMPVQFSANKCEITSSREILSRAATFWSANLSKGTRETCDSAQSLLQKSRVN